MTKSLAGILQKTMHVCIWLKYLNLNILIFYQMVSLLAYLDLNTLHHIVSRVLPEPVRYVVPYSSRTPRLIGLGISIKNLIRSYRLGFIIGILLSLKWCILVNIGPGYTEVHWSSSIQCPSNSINYVYHRQSEICPQKMNSGPFY